MRLKPRISRRDAESILRGRAPEPQLGRLADFVTAAKQLRPGTPSSPLEDRHLTAIAEARARLSEAGHHGRRGPGTGLLVAQVPAAGMSLALLMSGLAYAGVPAVPNPVEALFDAAGGGDDRAEDDDRPASEEPARRRGTTRTVAGAERRVGEERRVSPPPDGMIGDPVESPSGP